MPLADTRYLVERAAARGSGIGALNVVHLDTAEAYIAGAAGAGRPVILQVSENAVRYHRGLSALAAGLMRLAEAAPVPVGVHLDHAESVELVHEAVDLGFRSVMFDGSTLPDDKNEAVTRSVVEYCHLRGVSVEAELGEVGGKNGVHDPGARTDPQDAARFVAATGVDMLAVAVGSSHAMTSREAVLDADLIARTAAAVPVPLVLHGSSGVSDEGMAEAVAAGMTKINVATHLNRIFTESVRRQLVADPGVVDTRRWFRPALDAVATETTRLLSVLA